MLHGMWILINEFSSNTVLCVAYQAKLANIVLSDNFSLTCGCFVISWLTLKKNDIIKTAIYLLSDFTYAVIHHGNVLQYCWFLQGQINCMSQNMLLL